MGDNMEEYFKPLPRSYWEDIASRWDAIIDDRYTPNFYYYRTADFYIEEAVTGKHDILELGCGTGACTKNLLQNEKTIVAIDYSKSMIKLARKRLTGRKGIGKIYLALCDAHALPFKDAFFDAIISRGTLLSYSKNPSILLKECSRTLKKGGIIVLDAMNYNDFIKERERIWLTDKAVLDLIPCKEGVKRKLTSGGIIFSEFRENKVQYIFFRKYDYNKMQIRERFILKEGSQLVEHFKREMARGLRGPLILEKVPEKLMESSVTREVLYANYFTPDDLIRLLSEAGFGDISIHPLGHLCEITILRRLQYPKLFDFIWKNRDLMCMVEKILSKHLKLETAWHILALAKKS
jgi:ubiquinone/menaquinone biosynthesis C-methylase UbiE